MNLNRKELRKILYDFNVASNRLLQCSFEDYTNVLTKFISFIDNTPVIHDYIIGCGSCEQNMDEEFKAVGNGYTGFVFSLGDSDNEEVRNIYAILSHISAKEIQIHYNIARAYSHSSKFQEILKDFNDRVAKILIMHIESYLTKIGIDMGVDEQIMYNITNNNGQVIIAAEKSNVTATNNITIDETKLNELINVIKSEAETAQATQEELEIINSSLEVILEELKSQKPKKGFLNTAFRGLKALKFTAEFGAAVATLYQIVQTAGII